MRGYFVPSCQTAFQELHQSLQVYHCQLELMSEGDLEEVQFVLYEWDQNSTMYSFLEIRKRFLKQPILVIAKSLEEDQLIQLYQNGLDGYLLHPVSVRELLSRIKTILRRANGSWIFHLDDLRTIWIDQARNELLCCQRRVRLPAKVFQLFQYLYQRSGKLVTRRELTKEIWKQDLSPNSSTLNVHIYYLRRTLREHCSPLQVTILTRRGDGFILYIENNVP